MSASNKPGRPARAATPATGASHDKVVLLAGVRQRARVPLVSALPQPIVVEPEPAHNAGDPDNSKPASENGYSVGYGRPPRKSQFQKGQSGNNKGRPKAARNTSTMAKMLLDEKHVIHVNGKRKVVNTREAVLQVVRKKALNGDLKAVDKLYQMAGEALGPATQGEADASLHGIPTSEELAILAFHYRERLTDEGLTAHQIATVLAMLGLPDHDPTAGDIPDGIEPTDTNAFPSRMKGKAREEDDRPII